MAKKTLYVGNLPYSTSENDLLDAFAAFNAQNARIVEGRGFGFVDIDEDRLDEAINQIHNSELAGRKLTVNEARPRTTEGGGGGGGYGRGGYGGGGVSRDRGYKRFAEGSGGGTYRSYDRGFSSKGQGPLARPAQPISIYASKDLTAKQINGAILALEDFYKACGGDGFDVIDVQKGSEGDRNGN